MTTVVTQGPTPSGGVRSEAAFTARDGSPVEPDDPQAHAVEIHEVGEDGTVLARHYGLLKGVGGYPQQSVEVEDDEDADQTKATWDLWWVDGANVYHPVETLDQLLRSLGWDAQDLQHQRQLVATMLPLPSWQAAPEGLKAEVSAWLVRGRPEAVPEPHPMQPVADRIAEMLQVPPIDAAEVLAPIDAAELDAAQSLIDEVDAED